MIKQREDSNKKRNYIVRTYREGDEDRIIDMHRSGSPRARMLDLVRNEYWTWKNKLSPYFDPSLVIIAEENRRVIGCAHAQVRNLKISRSLTVKATQTADLFIRPEHRRRGVATEITRVLRKNLRERGAIILVGVTSPSTYHEFYSKRKAFTIPRNLFCKSVYVKKLNCASFERKAFSINKVLSEHPEIRNGLMKLNLTVLFRLKGFPPFVLKVSKGEVTIKEGEPVFTPNIMVAASRLSSATKVLTLIKMLFSGDLKVSGLLHNFVGLYRCFKILKKVERA